MRKSKLDNPRVRKRVIQKLVLGKSQTSIAKEVGVSQSRISRFASMDDIKPFLEKESMRLVELAPDALDNVEEAVKDKIKDIPKSNIKRRKFVLDASIDALKAVGIMPTNVQSQAILNIYQQNNLVMTPQLRAIIDAHNKTLMFSEEELKQMDEETEKDNA